ncbi:MAG: hypothetical protein KKF41_03465 [Actinobacteria bacterium]|nr:hypothetical protein [Actinomycetota bacterium]MBU1945039.1 hypothetical protein [Actinomycetota bacterium]MBU2686625.1 hypothetical protein [Actinomycetota bacterium]
MKSATILGSPTTISGRTMAVLLCSQLMLVMACYTSIAAPAGILEQGHGRRDSADSPLSTWYLAEGSTAWGFECYITIVNPNEHDVEVQATYMLSDGTNVVEGGVMAPESRFCLNPEMLIGNRDFSTRVESLDGSAIAVDRTMSWKGLSPTMAYHSSIGVTSPAMDWYLPEGSSAWGFETWLLIQNPNGAPVTCEVTYMIEGAGPEVVQHEVPGNARATCPIMVERAMYWNNRLAGTDTIGGYAD